MEYDRLARREVSVRKSDGVHESLSRHVSDRVPSDTGSAFAWRTLFERVASMEKPSSAENGIAGLEAWGNGDAFKLGECVGAAFMHSAGALLDGVATVEKLFSVR